MRPVWLIEAGVYGAEADPLLAEVRRQGMVAEAVPFSVLQKEKALTVGGRPPTDEDCVIGYGTFPFAREIQLHCHWVPGAWCDPTNLDCAAYFAHFGKFLPNQAGCHKLFTGRCVYQDDFAAALAPARYDPFTLVVVAAPRDIAKEWRLVVAEGRVVGASQYAVAGGKCLAPGCPQAVRDYAEAMLAEVGGRPDPAFLLDVCEADGQLWLVEVNGFGCS
jgi:hypothetical protein